MLNEDAVIAAAVVRDAMANIVEFVDQAAGMVLNADVDRLRGESHEIVMALMAHLITADGQYDSRERAFLAQLLDFGSEPNGELNFLRRYSERWRLLEKQVPEFFRTAVMSDKQHNTDSARGILREIQLIANNCSVSDHHFADKEMKIVRRYLRFLDEYLEEEMGGKGAWLQP